ncbi:MAG: hypothetical protein NUV80_02500 [Candidatus Berkelbacteria bacterium]|nr:hypothetical protein [Candidatus Berkelbacteria bacterium]
MKPGVEIKVSDVKNPTTVEVELSERPTTKVAGMEETIVRNKKSPGYDLKFGICTKCGEQSALKVLPDGTKELIPCPICRNKDIRHFKQTERTIARGKVADILSREVAYKDPKTGKLSKNPFKDSHLNENLATNSKDWQRGFLCSNCRRIYIKKVECCTDGKIISGKFLLDPTGFNRQVMGAV